MKTATLLLNIRGLSYVFLSLSPHRRQPTRQPHRTSLRHHEGHWSADHNVAILRNSIYVARFLSTDIQVSTVRG